MGGKNNEVLLKMEGIDKKFPGVHALKGVDFSLERGEVCAILGENGAGKSTLMNVLGAFILQRKVPLPSTGKSYVS